MDCPDEDFAEFLDLEEEEIDFDEPLKLTINPNSEAYATWRNDLELEKGPFAMDYTRMVQSTPGKRSSSGSRKVGFKEEVDVEEEEPDWYAERAYPDLKSRTSSILSTLRKRDHKELFLLCLRQVETEIEQNKSLKMLNDRLKDIDASMSTMPSQELVDETAKIKTEIDLLLQAQSSNKIVNLRDLHASARATQLRSVKATLKEPLVSSLSAVDLEWANAAVLDNRRINPGLNHKNMKELHDFIKQMLLKEEDYRAKKRTESYPNNTDPLIDHKILKARKKKYKVDFHKLREKQLRQCNPKLY